MLKKISAQVKLMTITWTKLKHFNLKSLWKERKVFYFVELHQHIIHLILLRVNKISSKFTGNLEPINFLRRLKNLRTNVQTFQHIWLVTTFFKVVSLTAILAFIESDSFGRDLSPSCKSQAATSHRAMNDTCFNASHECKLSTIKLTEKPEFAPKSFKNFFLIKFDSKIEITTSFTNFNLN